MKKGDNHIDHTSILEGQISLGENNRIGPFCFLQGKITAGKNNFLHSHVSSAHILKIGDNCNIYPYVSLGFPGEMGAKGDRLPEGKGVIIEDNVTIREFVNIHAPYWWDSTKIGENSYIMNKAYIAHDVQIGKNVLVNAGVLLGGRARIFDFANVGMGAAVHQRSVIGESAMVGMNTVVKKDIPPFCVVAGVPALILKFNMVGAERRGFDKEELIKTNFNFRKIIEGRNGIPDNQITEAVSKFFETYPNALRTFYNS